MLGSGLAQAIQFVAIPILSRLYEPALFAPLYQAQALATVLAIFATLQLHLTLPHASDDNEAEKWAKAVIALCLGICCILTPITYELFESLSAIALTLCLGITNTIINYQLYHQRFSEIAIFQLLRALVIVAAQVGLQVFFKLDNLLTATIVAECLVAVIFLLRTGLRRPTKRDFCAGLKLARHRTSFSIFGTLHEATSSAVFYAPLFLFSHFFSNATGAQFAMANRLVWAPVVLFAGSAAQVTYQRFCRHSPTELWSVLKTYLHESRRRAIWGLLLLLSAMATAPTAVALALGSSWATAGSMTPPLLLWGAAFLTSVPFRSACRALSLQGLQLIIEVTTGLCFIVIFVCHPADAIVALWLIVIVAIVQNLALAWVVKHKIDSLAAV